MQTILSDLARAVDIGLTILTHRLLTLLALVMVFALFSWAMVQGTYVHFAIAGAFGLVIFLPVLMADANRAAKPEAPNE
jgi:uncharacterized membrane protein